MRIIKDGPYGKTVYIDTGYVETNEAMVSNHVFMGNTRVASIVKHKDESQPATYYYATDHLGSSSVLTNQAGSYHEHIEYLPYGEVWVEDRADNEGYTTPYKFTGKELDKETNLYYFGARYYDARISRWISTDPALEKYFPKPNDYDTEHDFYWYILNDASGKLPGMGGVYNAHNLNVYCYSLNNPVKYYDPDGNITKLNIGEESVMRLAKAGARVIEDPEYRRGAGGHMNNNNPNATWCNQAAFDIIENTGLDITKFTLKGGRYQTRANDMVVRMIGAAIKGDLKMIDAKTAQELANKGYTVVAGAMGIRKNSDGSLESGHVAVVAPSDIRKFDENKGPMVYHVGGGTNKIMTTSDAFRYLFGDVKYFYDPKQKIK